MAMILAIDVHYLATGARVAGGLFPTWDSTTLTQELVINVEQVADYLPGQFYLRELPCIQTLLTHIKHPLDHIVIDGYVTLGSTQAPGLGMHLWHALAVKTPIIGVAKSVFQDTPESCKLYRGGSERPLFITAVGLPLEEARQCINVMAGTYRLPTLLKRVDQLCRGL